jgi:hypothetical protein
LGSGTNGSPIANTKANQFMLADTITDVRWSGIEYTLPSVQAANAGDVLSNDGAGVLSWVAGAQNLMNIVPEIASYILLDTDFDITQDTSIEMDVATANTLDINATLLTSVPIGSKINVIQYGVGQTQITVTAGAVLLSAGGADKIANQYGAATIVKRSATEFYLFGDITV